MPVRLLIIDDDRALRDALRRALSLAGYEIATAADAEEAQVEIARQPPDAVVLDIGLPGVDGLELCRRLRATGDRVPVLMLTAWDTVEDRIDGLDAGADDYLVKPFDMGELKARLRALLRRTVAEDAAGDMHVFAELRLDPTRHGVGAAVVPRTTSDGGISTWRTLSRRPSIRSSSSDTAVRPISGRGWSIVVRLMRRTAASAVLS